MVEYSETTGSVLNFDNLYGYKEVSGSVVDLDVKLLFTDTEMDDVRLFSSGLDQDEIDFITNNIYDEVGDEVLHLKMNEGVGETVHDSSGNNNDGSIKGASWSGGMKTNLNMNDNAIIDLKSIDGSGDSVQFNDQIDMDSNKITNLSDPDDDQDATTKSWVDSNFNDYSLESHDNTYHDSDYTTYDSADFDSDFDSKDTDDLSEGSNNKYFFDHDNSNHTETYLTDISGESIEDLSDVSNVSYNDGDVLRSTDSGYETETLGHDDLTNINDGDHHGAGNGLELEKGDMKIKTDDITLDEWAVPTNTLDINDQDLDSIGDLLFTESDTFISGYDDDGTLGIAFQGADEMIFQTYNDSLSASTDNLTIEHSTGLISHVTLSMDGNNKIVDLEDPSNDQDAVTLKWVEDKGYLDKITNEPIGDLSDVNVGSNDGYFIKYDNDNNEWIDVDHEGDSSVHHTKTTSYDDMSDTHDNNHHDFDNVISGEGKEYEIKKNGSDDEGIINFKT